MSPYKIIKEKNKSFLILFAILLTSNCFAISTMTQTCNQPSLTPVVLGVTGTLLITLLISYIALSSRISKLEEHNIGSDKALKEVADRLDKVSDKMDMRFMNIDTKIESKFEKIFDKLECIEKARK